MFKTLQKIGKAFMLPIAILPAAGLLLGIGGALSNPTTVKSYPVLDNPILQDIFQVMSAAGNVIFENLALLLSIGLCIGLAKRDKGTAHHRFPGHDSHHEGACRSLPSPRSDN